MHKLLIINPGSTSTKIAVFQEKECVFKTNIKHSAEEIAPFEHIADQYHFRKEVILNTLKDAGIELNDLSMVVGRGGLLKPLTSGIYEVNEAMKRDLVNSPVGEHACNLGGLIADDIAKSVGVKAYIADPVIVDEMEDVARFSGHPAFPRMSVFHALNQKMIARQHATAVGKKYEDLNLIGIHLGGGISVAAHKKGRVVDVNNALNGDGPFTPERSGALPSGPLMNACFSGKYTKKEIDLMLKGQGGFVAYLGTNDAMEVENQVKAGNKEWELVYRAMAYQVAKEVGGLAASAFCMDVDAIFVTGGMAYDKNFCKILEAHLGKIAPVCVYPGEDEMMALTLNGLMVLNNEIEAKIYE
ncbi:MAG: butyrate kinase [Bacteroidales bacterium]|nr:butyrate kinase [Bacteroidales bacterium]MBR5781501.1 butyrate kinase [Bacteroidales bacterium]